MTSGSGGGGAGESAWAFAASLVVSLLLIAAGVALALYANSIRNTLHVASSTCVVTSSDIGDAPGRREDEPAVTRLSATQAPACSVSRLPAGLRLAQLTIRREPASDTLLAALLATALALGLCGAFFARVESVTVGGVGFGIRRREKRHDRQDTGTAVDRVAADYPQDIPRDTIEKAKLATFEKAGDLREVAAGKRAIAPIDVPADRLGELRRGNPLPADLLTELASRALDEQLEREHD